MNPLITISKSKIVININNSSNNVLNLDIAGQTVEKLNETTYLFKPSGVIISINFLSFIDDFFQRKSESYIITAKLNEIEFKTLIYTFHPFVNQYNQDNIIAVQNLIKFLDNLVTQRELKSLKQINNLSNNTKGVISSFITGKTGSIQSQTNKIQQNLGTSLAPRPRKRKTRRTRKY